MFRKGKVAKNSLVAQETVQQVTAAFPVIQFRESLNLKNKSIADVSW